MTAIAALPTHYGKRSWWTGAVRTLCGQVLPAGTRWTPFGPTCPICSHLKATGQGAGYR